MFNQTKTMCIQFNCDHMHGNHCCAFCKHKKKCKNHCLNTPDKCKLAAEKANKSIYLIKAEVNE